MEKKKNQKTRFLHLCSSPFSSRRFSSRKNTHRRYVVGRSVHPIAYTLYGYGPHDILLRNNSQAYGVPRPSTTMSIWGDTDVRLGVRDPARLTNATWRFFFFFHIYRTYLCHIITQTGLSNRRFLYTYKRIFDYRSKSAPVSIDGRRARLVIFF